MAGLAIDICCSAGGATRGLQNAGFKVLGVDVERQPHYIGDWFVQADLRNLTPEFVRRFDFAWASPPCQAHTIASRNHRDNGKVYADFITETRALLIAAGIPFAIENVPGAPIRSDVILCGSQFGLPVVRHRPIELSFSPPLTAPCNHPLDVITVCGHGTPQWMRKKRIERGLHPNASVAMKKAAMGIDWMNRAELSQAIPPAYSEFIARAFLAQRQQERAA